MRGEGLVAVALVGLGVFASCSGGGGGGGETFTPAGAAAAAPAAAQARQAAPGSSAASLAGCVGPVPNLDREQADIAVRGYRAAQRAGAGAEGARIIVAAGLVESRLRNLPNGDRDSKGWLQQRPSKGWMNSTDVDKAADDFFTEMKRLVPGWRGMDPGAVAQAVQRSAYPSRYADQMERASAIVAAIEGKAGSCQAPAPVTAANVGDCPASGSSAEKGLQPKALRVLRCGKKAWPYITQLGGVGGRPGPSDHPSGRAVDFMIPSWNTTDGRAKGWEVARWFEKNAASLNVKYVIWDAKIWNPSRSGEGWRPYQNPSLSTAKTEAQRNTMQHLDHVHVSVTS